MPISMCGDNLQIASWNGGGIVVHRKHEYFDMVNAIRKLAFNTDILCFQEVHGLRASVLSSFRRWLPGWNISHSECVDFQNFPDPASGGCVIAICPKLCGTCEIESKEIVPGRCLSVSLWAQISGILRNLHILTLHNYGLTSEQVSAVGAKLDSIGEVCLRQPNKDFACFIGDFIFLLGMSLQGWSSSP